ncbi:MAG: hypothetical protein E7645_00625 [Ruminococcaceae bacterium]|nr:hypothetical protein [Oscillospiraceae bacterium]
MNKLTVILSILLLLAALVVNSLFFLEPLESIPFLSSIIATMQYYTFIAALYAAIYMVPQIIFVVALAVILWMTFRSHKKGTLTRKTAIAIGILNGISLVLMIPIR